MWNKHTNIVILRKDAKKTVARYCAGEYILEYEKVEIEGLEPSLTEPESVVLPLHHISICHSRKTGVQKYNTFIKSQKKCYKILRFSRTTAQTSQPSPLPTKPRRSVVVAFTLTRSAWTSITFARISRI